jgi:hypothetical protein
MSQSDPIIEVIRLRRALNQMEWRMETWRSTAIVLGIFTTVVIIAQLIEELL